jgi:hypothetical protein
VPDTIETPSRILQHLYEVFRVAQDFHLAADLSGFLHNAYRTLSVENDGDVGEPFKQNTRGASWTGSTEYFLAPASLSSERGLVDFPPQRRSLGLPSKSL